MNVTAVPGGPLGFLTLWSGSDGPPVASTLNAWLGEIVANAAIVPTGASPFASPGFALYGVTAPGSRADVVIDLNGYFAP